MSRMLAIEWADRGIRVNAVVPAACSPNRGQRLRADAARKRMLARIPGGRRVEREEVAAAVVSLADAESGAIAGHSLRWTVV